jgi:quercetin dioxygenase-like cupin family protein
MNDSKDFDPILNLAKIREYTSRADVVPIHNIAHIQGSMVEYDCIQGSCKAVSLAYHSQIGVIKAELTENTVVCNHIHPELEILHILSGEMFQELAGASVTSAKPDEQLIAPPNVEHKHYCIVPTTLIAITIPASEGYPHND